MFGALLGTLQKFSQEEKKKKVKFLCGINLTQIEAHYTRKGQN